MTNNNITKENITKKNITDKTIIEVKNINLRFGKSIIHSGLDLSIYESEIIGIVGSSGSGKTTLLREILMLQKPDSGSIKINGVEVTNVSHKKLSEVRQHWGVLFQQNALFSSLTVLENITFLLREKIKLDEETIQDIAIQKILSVGFPLDSINKYPAQLSGGMEKRAALARSIIMDPDILFLDEPTTGLDPDSASELDELILNLQSTLGLTIVLVTHDLDTLWKVTDRVAFLHKGKVLCVDAISKLIENPHEAIQTFFNGPRGRAAKPMDEAHGN